MPMGWLAASQRRHEVSSDMTATGEGEKSRFQVWSHHQLVAVDRVLLKSAFALDLSLIGASWLDHLCKRHYCAHGLLRVGMTFELR